MQNVLPPVQKGNCHLSTQYVAKWNLYKAILIQELNEDDCWFQTIWKQIQLCSITRYGGKPIGGGGTSECLPRSPVITPL